MGSSSRSYSCCRTSSWWAFGYYNYFSPLQSPLTGFLLQKLTNLAPFGYLYQLHTKAPTWFACNSNSHGRNPTTKRVGKWIVSWINYGFVTLFKFLWVYEGRAQKKKGGWWQGKCCYVAKTIYKTVQRTNQIDYWLRLRHQSSRSLGGEWKTFPTTASSD